jgi:FKBP-type peptidyl-prolyl cis-trans isomerase
MIRNIMAITAAAMIGAGAQAQEVSGELDELSYKMGYDLGKHIEQLGITELNFEVFARAMSDSMAGRDSAMTDAQLQSAEQTRLKLQQVQMDAKRKELAAASENNRKAGEAYLAGNASREGVMTTDSGMQYEVIEMGDGPRPIATDTVTVHYRGTLIDGTEFDSSYSRGEPTTFGLNRVISGWTEGLQLMPIGSKFKFHIPADLAYGGRTTGKIGPNSTLVFEVEMISIGE